ncbi:MAG: ATP-binding protein [Streptosporangiaceae bacterium]|jgi:hypothetical protein
MNGSRSVGDGRCLAWPLPADATCAKVARRSFTAAVADLRLPDEIIEDGILMASELAANTLHARGCGGGGQRDLEDAGDGPGPLPACPEMWMYLRTSGAGRELVCKVFDRSTGWRRGTVPAPGTQTREPDEDDGEGGRGLEVVHELSAGRWGFHLSRGRLGSGRGKAVWFAQPLPQSKFPAQRRKMPAGDAARYLQAALDARGFAGRLVRADDPTGDMSVVSVSDGLAVWCRAGVAWLRIPGQEGLSWSFDDLVEVAEQAVRAHEELGHDRPHLVTAEAAH